MKSEGKREWAKVVLETTKFPVRSKTALEKFEFWCNALERRLENLPDLCDLGKDDVIEYVADEMRRRMFPTLQDQFLLRYDRGEVVESAIEDHDVFCGDEVDDLIQKETDKRLGGNPSEIARNLAQVPRPTGDHLPIAERIDSMIEMLGELGERSPYARQLIKDAIADHIKF